MRNLVVILITVMLCGFFTAAEADIYGWTDEKGVKHFTNYAPPDQAEPLIKTEELPYTGMSDEELRAAERAERLAAAQWEMVEREAEILEKQSAAERRIEEADQKAADMIQEAAALLEKAGEAYQNTYRNRYGYYGYYPVYKPWRHRKKHIIHYQSPYGGRRHDAKVKSLSHSGSKPGYGREKGSGRHGPSRGIKNRGG